MSNLVQHAEDELKRAGFFDQDSDYVGLVGPAVMEMMKQFAQEGHSGYSASLCLRIFDRLARYKLLMPIENPMIDQSFIDHTDISGGHPTFQSNRLSSLFSEDGGKRWYDIDLRVSRWKRWFGIRRQYVKFPYLPR
jgi:hypothetical protein